jgi:hypothetical protein
MSAAVYRVPRGGKFAEIRVVRAGNLDGDASFTWWTQGGTAQPGVDYGSQERTTQLFPPGRRATSVFVRILPDSERKSARAFYVVIGNLRGAVMGHRAKTTVSILP